MVLISAGGSLGSIRKAFLCCMNRFCMVDMGEFSI